MHALTSNILDFQVRKYFSMPEVMEKAPLWGCSFWGERMFSCVHHPGWIQLFLPQCLNYKKKKFLLWERKGSDESFQPCPEQQREIGTFMARFASYQNVWIKQFICLSPSIESKIRLWLTPNTCSACISLRSSQVRCIQSTIFLLSYGCNT